MIYEVISAWVEEKVAAFNLILDEKDKLRGIDTNLDTGFLPSSMKDKRYLLKLGSLKQVGDEAGTLLVKVNLEFHFQLFKKPLESYRMYVDEYLFRFIKLLQDDTVAGLEYESGGMVLVNIRNLEITGLDKTDKGGAYLMPAVEFEMEAVG
jgi:hypothetical protein